MNYKVSCVIPTFNSEEFLRDCLISLKACKQMYPDMEVIVVDNYSLDTTLAIAFQLADKVYHKGPERVAQANYGISKASGDIIYLTGSDLTRDWEFIIEGVKKLNQGFDAIYMSVLTHPRVKHFWGRVKKLERECYVDTFIESARFFKKSVWEQLNGFNESMISMEEDFQHRLDNAGCFTGRIKSREYHLHEDDTLWKVFKKAYYYGKFMKPYLKKHKGRGLKQLNPIRPNFDKFLRHPKLFIGLIVYKVVQYTGGLIGLLKWKTKLSV